MSAGEVLRKYFYFIGKTKWQYAFMLLLVVITALLNRLVPYLAGRVIDELTLANFAVATEIVTTVIIVMIATSAIGQLKNLIGDMIFLRNLVPNARLDYIKALQEVDYDYHTNKSSGALISLAKRGDAALFTAFWEVNGISGVLVLEFVITVIALGLLNPYFGLVMGISIVLTLAVGIFLVRYNVTRRKIANAADDKITALTVDNLIGFETVKIFARENWELERFRREFVPWKRAQMDYIYTFRYLDIGIAIVTIATFALIFFVGLTGMEMGTITVGVFAAAMVYMFDIARGTFDVIYNIRNLAKSYTDLSSYFEVMALRPKIVDKPGAQHLSLQEGKIEFKDVHFNYPGQKEVLSDIDLAVKAGERLALVGKSGSGKTTLTKLLLRFYLPSRGEIVLDGQNLSDVTGESVRQAVGLVPQDPVLFNDSIGYNIGYGRVGASPEEIVEAAKLANLHDFIIELPQKYDTLVGERGIKLSGGQRQRLAIARVFLENPDIVIFDEATSQLDSENEKQIQEAFRRLTKDKTTIIIAHRLSTVMDANRIAVFSKGKIVELGKHAELIDAGGTYAKLWELQTGGLIG